jgi:hypothetical protein
VAVRAVADIMNDIKSRLFIFYYFYLTQGKVNPYSFFLIVIALPLGTKWQSRHLIQCSFSKENKFKRIAPEKQDNYYHT